MEILHVSAECYPMAKAGGLADVVGALPKYQQRLGHTAKVVVPMHRTKFLYDNEWEVAHKGQFLMAHYVLDFTVIKEKTNKLDFDLYCIDIHGLLDREKIYGYDDDTERFMAFQIAVIEWLSKWTHHPDVVHVHDHHAALIPFMMRQCFAYRHLSKIAVTLTIHNAQYQGWMDWNKVNYIPAWDTWKWGLLDWNKIINPLACGVKCADKVSTVSPGYMTELKYAANGLESLFEYESGKCSGILNGIDYEVWDPLNDGYINGNFNLSSVDSGKALNKKKLCDDFGFNIKYPLFVFIGRLVNEKAADLLPEALLHALKNANGKKCSVLILGSGEPSIEKDLTNLKHEWFGYYNSQIGYNEKLSHQMYAGADFLLMPSRVESCGLNQMYAMRYATVPVVRRIGGLKDTVIDYEDDNGYGICFDRSNVHDIVYSIYRGVELYKNKKLLQTLRSRMMKVNNSWEASAQKYIDLYKSIYK